MRHAEAVLTACGHPKETPEHFLLQCPIYAHERWPILNKLGGNIPKLSKLLTSAKLLLPLANFIEASGRFELDIRTAPVSYT